MIQLKVITGLLSKVLPTLGKQKAQSSSVDSVLSKRGETTQAEVFAAFGYKVLSLAFKVYLAHAIISGNVSIGDLLKALSLGV